MTENLEWTRAMDLNLGDEFIYLGIKYRVKRIENGTIWYGAITGGDTINYFGAKSMWFVLKIKSHTA